MQSLRSCLLKFARRKSLENLPPPRDYFSLHTKILLYCGMYPIGTDNVLVIIVYWMYFVFGYVVFVGISTATKGIALFHETNLDDVTDNISFLISHVVSIFRIAVFIYKRNDIVRLVSDIEGEVFKHEDCKNFSPNHLIRNAVKTSRMMFYVFTFFATATIANGAISAAFERSKVLGDFNISGTSIGKTHGDLPYEAWFPFSTQQSPNYELIFLYQIVAILYVSQIIMSLDTMIAGFMIHLKVQFEILGHNLRFMREHAENEITQSSSTELPMNLVNRIMEEKLKKNIVHHEAIIELAQNLESVFSNVILLQFVCIMFTICVLLWQVSSVSPLSAKFVSMFFYLSTMLFQLFLYCWYGNEVMLESLLVEKAAWDCSWADSTQICKKGVLLTMHRSQRAVMLTVGGFAAINLETFMTILQGSYSYFAVLRNMGR